MRNMAMPQFAGAKLHLFYQTTKFFLQLFTLKCSFYGFCSIFKPYFLLFIKERRQFFHKLNDDKH